MMTPRQEAFRADYRARISPWYSGLAHVVVIACDRPPDHRLRRHPCA